MPEKLDALFYQHPDVLLLARQLIGHKLVTKLNNEGITSGMIVETEAYNGIADRASHAYGGRRTNRTEIMYAEGGIAYVYLCYGIHHLFNIVTGAKNNPQAILIRAIQPIDGMPIMLKRRNLKASKPNLSSGPGSAACSLGIKTHHSGLSLTEDAIWIEPYLKFKPHEIQTGPRVGVAYAGDDANNPWRFSLKNNSWVSPAK